MKALLTHDSFGLHIKKNKLNPQIINWGVADEIKQIYNRKLHKSRLKLAEDIKKRGQSIEKEVQK